MKRTQTNYLMLTLILMFTIINPLVSFALGDTPGSEQVQNTQTVTVKDIQDDFVTLDDEMVTSDETEDVLPIELDGPVNNKNHTIENILSAQPIIVSEQIIEVNENTAEASMESQTFQIKVTKIWNGEKGASVTVHLLADGKEVGKITLTADNKWTYTFENMPLYNEDGTEIEYTVTDDSYNVQMGVKKAVVIDTVFLSKKMNGYKVINTTMEEEIILEPETLQTSGEETPDSVTPLQPDTTTENTVSLAIEKPYVLPAEDKVTHNVEKEDNSKEAEAIPQLNWKSHSELYMMGIGWILLAVFLLFQRKKKRISNN